MANKIYLQIDDEIVQVPDWSIIKNREHYTEALDIKGKSLEKIIGYYELDEKISCGLKNCNTPHLRGYIVKTDAEIETNIGNACGNKYFDVIFGEMSSEFLNKVEYEKLKQSARLAKPEIFTLWKKINELTVGPKNILWAIRLFKDISDPNIIGRSAYNRLQIMYGNNDNKVYLTTLTTAKEKELAEVAGRRIDETVDIVVGQIKYIDFLSKDDSLDSIFYSELKAPVSELESCDPERTSRTKLKKIMVKINAINTNITRLKDKLEIARLFFTNENLSQLLNWMEKDENVSNADIERYQTFLEKL
ncbi:hypothetical protein I6G31_13755 [Proteus penneri]|nr:MULTISPECIES: hypothetical protein [Proteus]NBN74782.1 hypothetical protein [Proteus sp. G2615]QPT33154.1 hypothetical protein I6G31_13755 [Proteus penneri]